MNLILSKRSRLGNLLQNAAAFVIGCALAFLILETFLWIYHPFPRRIKGDEIVLPIHQKYVVVNQGFDKLDRNIIHRKNSLGFRGPEPPENFQTYTTFIAVGGSTTECYYLSDGKDWPAQLQKRLRQQYQKIWINNAGLDGHSTFGHTILLRDYLTKLKPDYILFLVGANDIGRTDLTHYDKKHIQYADAGWKNNLIKQSEVLSLLYSMSKSFKALQKGLTHRFPNLLQMKHQQVDPSAIITAIQRHDVFLNHYEARLTQLMQMTIHAGIQPILITQPTLLGEGVDDLTGVNLETIQLKGRHGKTYWSVLQAYNRITRQVGEKLKIPVIPLGEQMPKSSRYFYDAIHFTNAGAELLGGMLANALQQQHILKAHVSTPK
ncbi:SGNH/GDSL hydrolase family protein [Candidatus Entotheonella palauensis]|uniref:SGNH/GDSL hydrolase family protein n=1 Tax=Candidatus Entotheonella palauensis TaxID=93172 RepID=UPI000B7CB1C7|nr:SGNH/GDSL hydrolase family protein [Candidatus Entotheonella palauensis]